MYFVQLRKIGFFFFNFFVVVCLRSVMASGSSTEWKFLFETIVGHRRVEIEPLLEYFQPLHNHLLKTNQETNEHIGWK